MKNVILNLYLTYKCNFQCNHCLHNCSPDRNEFMTPTQIEYVHNVIVQLMKKNYQISVIGLSGGEPMMHPSFYPILEGFLPLKKVIPIELHTNGSIPFSQDLAWMNFFRLVRISTDIFHEKFRKVSTLNVNSFYNSALDVLVHKGTWVKDKGRGANIDPSLSTPVSKEYCYFDNKNIYLTFDPNGIRFCLENSTINRSESPNFTAYKDEYITDIDQLLLLGDNFVQNHTGVNCKNKCKYGMLKV